MGLTRILMILAAAVALVAVDGAAVAQPKEKDKDRKEQKEQKAGGPDGKEKKVKQHKHKNGKALLGDRIKKNGKHKLEQHGKHAAYANVKDGKITGVTVEHSEKGPVPVTKYKTTKKMAAADGIQPVALHLAQQSMGSTWIGYAYIDEWGDEVIYWYEYEMIYDGDTGAVDYVPVY